MFKSDEENEFEGVILYIVEYDPSVRTTDYKLVRKICQGLLV